MSTSHLRAMFIFFPACFTCCLLICRIFISESLFYSFLPWNMFLAWIPLFVSGLIKRSDKFLQLVFILIWLLFLPNSLYIITDLLHLRYRAPIPMWFDIMLIFSAALNGLMFAYISLIRIEQFFMEKFNKGTSVTLICLSLFLSSFGVYLGRFLRLNSWDVINDPYPLIQGITDRFLFPTDHPTTWSMTIVISLFTGVFYFIISRMDRFELKI